MCPTVAPQQGRPPLALTSQGAKAQKAPSLHRSPQRGAPTRPGTRGWWASLCAPAPTPASPVPGPALAGLTAPESHCGGM